MHDLKAVLEDELVSVGLVPAGALWSELFGGRTNRVWRVQLGDVDIVCKLYSDAQGNKLFPNDPMAEKSSLQALAGTCFVPRLEGFHMSSLGAVVIYAYVDGAIWDQGVRDVAQVLRRLHDQTPPRNLRRLKGGSDDILSTGQAILDLCADRSLMDVRPREISCPAQDWRFVHTDVVPANVVVSDGHVTLIDWQCPAIGDPCEDLASFLSPAMQMLYRGRVLDDLERAAFLKSYDCTRTYDRFMTLEAQYLWRTACYCEWRAEQGEPGYKAAQLAELARLEQLNK